MRIDTVCFCGERRVTADGVTQGRRTRARVRLARPPPTDREPTGSSGMTAKSLFALFAFRQQKKKGEDALRQTGEIVEPGGTGPQGRAGRPRLPAVCCSCMARRRVASCARHAARCTPSHCSLLTAHCTLYTAHCCTLHTAHCTCRTLTGHCTLSTLTLHTEHTDTAHCTLHTARCAALHSNTPSHCTLHAAHTAHYTLHTSRFTDYAQLHTTTHYCALHTTHCTATPTAHPSLHYTARSCTLHPAHCTLHTAPCTLHPAHCTPADCTLHTLFTLTLHTAHNNCSLASLAHPPPQQQRRCAGSIPEKKGLGCCRRKCAIEDFSFSLFFFFLHHHRH